MLISILIPTYNRCECLVKAVESLMAQKRDDRFSFELLVVDDASTDPTKALVQELARKYGSRIRLIEGEGNGVASARNRGIEEAQGEWIAFMDDDQIAGPAWLFSLIEMASQKRARCVVGKRLLLLPDTMNMPLNAHLRNYLGEDRWGENARLLLPEEIPNTGNALLEKELLDEVGGFDLSYQYGGEDSDFFFRLKKAGIPIWYNPEAVMYHVISKDRLNERYIKTKAYRDGISKAMFYQKHGLLQELLRDLFKWSLLTTLRRRWFFQQKSPAEDLGGKYTGWYTWGYLRQTFAYHFPCLFMKSRFFSNLQFRKVHKKGQVP